MNTRQWWHRVAMMPCLVCLFLAWCAFLAVLHHFATSRLSVETSAVAVLRIPAAEVASELNP